MVDEAETRNSKRELSLDELPDVPARKVKPSFIYYEPNPETLKLVRKLNITFTRETNVEHFVRCPGIAEEREWYQEHFDTYFAREYHDWASEMASLGLTPKQAADRYKSWGRQIILNEFNGRVCIIELQAACELLEHLQKSYDLSNPKVWMIVRELISQYMLNMRLDNDFSEHGLVTSAVSNRGDTFRLVHAGAKTKSEFGKLFLDNIRLLDDVTKASGTITITGELTVRQLMEALIEKHREPKMVDVTPSKFIDAKVSE